MKKYYYTKRPKIKVKKRYSSYTMRSTVKKERDFRIINVLAVLLALGTVIFGGWWGYNKTCYFLFQSGCFEIQKIDIKGLKIVPVGEVEAILPFRKGDNMLKFWPSIAERSIENARPELKNINITRRWHSVTVEAEERVPLAFTIVDGKKLGLDADNRPFPLKGKWILAAGSGMPEVVFVDEAQSRLIIDFIGMISSDAKELYGKAAKLWIEPRNNIVIDTKQGTKIFWGEPVKKKISPKLTKLNQVFEDASKRFSGIDYINLYYFEDGRILVKPSGAAFKK